MSSRTHTLNGRELDIKLAKFKAYLEKEAEVPLGNKMMGDSVAGWARKTWAYQTWTDVTKTRFIEFGDELHYKRVLQEEMDKHMASLKRNLGLNMYSSLIMDLVDEMRVEGESALFLLGLGVELSRMEKGVATHTSLLNMIHKHPGEYGKIRKLRGEQPDEMSVLEQTWSQLDQLRETSKGELEKIEEVNSSFGDDEPHILPALEGVELGEDLGSEHRIEVNPIGKLHVRKMMRSKWEAVETKVRNHLNSLVDDTAKLKDQKDTLWKRQNMTEQALRDVVEMYPPGKELAEYKRMLKHYRPAFRGEMARLIANAPEFAELVYDILDALMTKEVGAIEFLQVAIELAKNKQYKQPLEEILADLQRDEPEKYSNAETILEKMSQLKSFIPATNLNRHISQTYERLSEQEG